MLRHRFSIHLLMMFLIFFFVFQQGDYQREIGSFAGSFFL